MTQQQTGIKAFISRILIRRGFRKLVKKISQLKPMDADGVVSFLFSEEAALIRPWQFREELTGMAKEIEKLQSKTVMEIGTANGGTLFTAAQLSAPDALIISLDLPGGKFGGGYPEWKVPVYSAFARANQQVKLVRGDSHTPESFEKIKSLLNGRQIDYLFIDGDHTYEGVKKDFEMYSPFVRKGGTVTFHDIVEHKGSNCTVDIFWREIREKYPHKEYVNDWQQGKFGVGVLYF